MKLLMLCLLMSVLGTSSYAQETKPSCDKVIETCDKAIAAQQRAIEVGHEALEKSQEQVKALKDEVKAKDDKAGNILRQTPILVGVGVVATALGGVIPGVIGLIVLSVILK